VSLESSARVVVNVDSAGNINLNNGSASIGGNATATGTVKQKFGNPATTCINDASGSRCINCNITGKVVSGSASVATPRAPCSPTTPLLATAPTAEPVPVLKADKSSHSPTALTLGWGQSKTFTAGDYYFTNITTQWGSGLIMDISGGDINIFCTGTVDMRQGTGLKISADGGTPVSMSSVDQALAAKIYLEANGNISLGYQVEWFGTLLTGGTLTLDRNNFIGMYQSTTGSVNITDSDTAKVVYVPSNYAMTHWYDTQPTP
jgi:hypothetical protein